MSRPDEIAALDAVEVAYVDSASGPTGAGAAFTHLESYLSSLRGRRFYAAYFPPDGPYRACVALREGETTDVLPLPRWRLPGGQYLRRKLEPWAHRVDLIGPTFQEMAASCRPDPDRPSIEYYRSRRTLVLYLPVLAEPGLET